MIAGVYLVAAMVYPGMFWTLHLDSNSKNHTYIIWYVDVLKVLTHTDYESPGTSSQSLKQSQSQPHPAIGATSASTALT